jgi:hypothetical protein
MAARCDAVATEHGDALTMRDREGVRSAVDLLDDSQAALERARELRDEAERLRRLTDAARTRANTVAAMHHARQSHSARAFTHTAASDQ